MTGIAAPTALASPARAGGTDRGPAGVAQRAAARLTGSPWFWTLFVLLAFGLPLARSLRRPLPPAPPVLGTLPAFAALDQDGQPFTTATVRGQILIAEFVTPASLEASGSPLVQLQKRVRNTGDRVHLVSFVSGVSAAPDGLARLAADEHAGAWRWTLAGLPGDASLAAETLRALGAPDAPPASLDRRLLLVDGRGRIRRLLGSSSTEIDLMMRDIGLLANVEGQ